ncbi:MAG TPA: phosphoadenosine phosphosulfate reductase family protein [Sphingobacteriaceae bacterium]|nr:phosphoadenosine phosphosulfate reductase family protein [Sphingobacteriaceae bacterium]
MKKVYLQGTQLVVTYSGGKDSTLMLLLLWEMLSELPASMRTQTVHLISSDTGVETPDMADYQMRALRNIESAAKSNCIPIDVTLVKPSLKQSFFYKNLGRGTLISTPKTRHRWCTYSLKISPTQEKLKELIARAPITFDSEKQHQLILMLGARNEESARRRASIAKYEISEKSYFSRHSDFKEILCYSPLKFVTADELWFKSF